VPAAQRDRKGAQRRQRRQQLPLERRGFLQLVALPLRGLFDLIEFFQQIQELIRDRLILHRAIESAQFRANIGIRAKPIIRAPLSRDTHFVHLGFVFHYPDLEPE
jgi:hypothetical protein